jgi:hypothetical protein
MLGNNFIIVLKNANEFYSGDSILNIFKVDEGLIINELIEDYGRDRLVQINSDKQTIDEMWKFFGVD